MLMERAVARAAQMCSGFGGQYGYYTDTETGLLCLTHRYYDPGTGKFINRDPIGYEGGMNLYGFADGNPVNESDPSGFVPSGSVFRFPDDPRGPKWYPQNLSQARARAVNNWYNFGDALQSAGANALELIRQLDNSECGCSQTVGSVSNKNGYRTPDGKFTTPGGPEKSGALQVEAVEESILRKKGYSLVGREVFVRMNGLARRYDLVVKGPSGKLIGIEVKSGSAVRTPAQRAFDLALNSSGRGTAQGVGKFKGFAVSRAVVIRRP